MEKSLNYLSNTNNTFISELKKETGLENLTLEELTNKLYQFPIDSIEYQMIRLAIQTKLEGEKYDEYLIAFPSLMNKDKDLVIDPVINSINGIKRIYREPISRPYSVFIYDVREDISIFSEEMTFLEDERFLYKQRRELEYNPKFKQLVVGCYVTDGDNIVLLQTKKNGKTRIEDRLTLIQGHVSFDSNAYVMSQLEFLRENMIREFEEEVDTKNLSLYFPIKPNFYINDNRNHIGLEHFGIIYEIRTEPNNFEYLSKSFSSNEEEKHSVIVLELRSLIQNQDLIYKLDDWAKLVVHELSKEI